MNEHWTVPIERVSPSYLFLSCVAVAAGLAASIVFIGEDSEVSRTNALLAFNLAGIAALGMIALAFARPSHFAVEWARLTGLFLLGLAYAIGLVFDVMYVMFTLVFSFFGGDVSYLDRLPWLS